MLGRDRTALPRVRVALAVVIDEREALPLRILEVEREPPVALDDLAGLHAVLAQVSAPTSPAHRARRRAGSCARSNACRAAPAAPASRRT